MLDIETLLSISDDLKRVISDLDIEPIKYFDLLISHYSDKIDSLSDFVTSYIDNSKIVTSSLPIIANYKFKRDVAIKVSEEYFKIYIV